jgi:hypothetical protein
LIVLAAYTMLAAPVLTTSAYASYRLPFAPFLVLGGAVVPVACRLSLPDVITLGEV